MPMTLGAVVGAAAAAATGGLCGSLCHRDPENSEQRAEATDDDEQNPDTYIWRARRGDSVRVQPDVVEARRNDETWDAGMDAMCGEIAVVRAVLPGAAGGDPLLLVAHGGRQVVMCASNVSYEDDVSATMQGSDCPASPTTGVPRMASVTAAAAAGTPAGSPTAGVPRMRSVTAALAEPAAVAEPGSPMSPAARVPRMKSVTAASAPSRAAAVSAADGPASDGGSTQAQHELRRWRAAPSVGSDPPQSPPAQAAPKAAGKRAPARAAEGRAVSEPRQVRFPPSKPSAGMARARAARYGTA
eukprot:TRINITY_DN6719_c1_g1_i2.p2 TRINITY_DN6719_c1_g1~~TRINITY_DN6719_c1_g1_i2.p2  ORF type:complete len:330 (+),score=54.13 TRINITY_DN6719_c1_g1_i2:91-990(+)